ncbi:MAG: winged helix DNA-binding protein [Porphyrobacter sp.]|nr:winged helix DNA-binding protein [Porphyrobacter sp.]
MPQADFDYGAAAAAGAPMLSIFADRRHRLDALREEAVQAGFGIATEGPLAALTAERPPPPGEAILIDCPLADEPSLAALARADAVAASGSAAQLIVATGTAALDAVFACCQRSAPQILVDPGPADRAIALGRVLAAGRDGQVREISEADRLTLLRLTEQVSQIASRLDPFGSSAGEAGGAGGRVASPALPFAGTGDPGSERPTRTTRPPLPDPRLVRRIIRQRQLRAQFIEGNLFADPAWDMLLDLTAARAEHVRVSVSSLCIASGVPPTTALRWIAQMTDAGLLERVEDEADRRRAFIGLTERAADAMARYFAEIGRDSMQLV